jgi:DNA-binding transcriptional regulator YdaS (Cro superfamily)
MDLLTYINDTSRRQRLADELGKSPDYLWQIATGWKGRKSSPDLAMDIEDATRRLGPETVPVQSMLPDLEWQRDAEGLVVGHLVRRPESKRSRQEKSAEAA